MISDNQKKYAAAALASISLGGLVYYFTRPSKSTSKSKSRKSKKISLSKYSKEYTEHPFNIVFACDEEFINLYVAGDTKNTEQGLKVGSMLVKIGDARVAGESSEKLQLSLRRVKDFPVKLQFLEQPHLEEKWTKSQEFRLKGKALFIQKKFAEALLEYDEAIKLHPTLKLLHSNKVLCLMKLQKYDMALSASHEMLKLDPQFPKGHYLKGWCHLELGKATESDTDKSIYFSHAVSELRTTLKKQPENKPAQAKLKESEMLLQEVKTRMEESVKKEMEARAKAREDAIKAMKESIKESTTTDGPTAESATLPTSTTEGNITSETTEEVVAPALIEPAGQETSEATPEASSDPTQPAEPAAASEATPEASSDPTQPAEPAASDVKEPSPAASPEKKTETSNGEYVIVTPTKTDESESTEQKEQEATIEPVTEEAPKV